MTQINWKQLAAEAVKSGYQPGNSWEAMLDRHLQSHLPDLVKELNQSGDYQAYLQARTNNCLDEYLAMVDQGTDPHEARSSAMRTLLPTPPDEIDRPEAWEQEAGMSDQMEATERFLSSLN